MPHYTIKELEESKQTNEINEKDTEEEENKNRLILNQYIYILYVVGTGLTRYITRENVK